jgi:hypothetical protein
MTTRLAVSTLFLFATSSFVFAAGPVGTISSADTFELHGASVNPGGIPSWPLAGGDEIATHVSSAVVRLGAGSSVTLAADSRARVESTGGRITLRLLSGSMLVNSSTDSSVMFYNNSDLVKAQSQPTTVVSSRGATNPVNTTSTFRAPPRLSAK